MFEELYPGPIALPRHRTSPFADERRQFLQHLHDLGYARLSLKAVACELVVITQYLDVSGEAALDLTTIETAAKQWAADQMRRRRGTNAALSTRNFRYWATAWLRWWGRLIERPSAAAPPFRSLLEGFKTYMANEQGLTPLSIRSHAWKTEKFLAWYWPHGRVFADVTLQDVDAFLTVKGNGTWSRRSVNIAGQALRAFFRYAERTHQCRAGLAAHIVRAHEETRNSGLTSTEA